MQNVKWTNRVEHSRNIPAAYHRLVCQLTAEIAHAPKQSDHKAIRRCIYATEVLDAFAMELYSVHSPTPDFWLKVLTPILQRQLRGLPDFYYPPIVTAIAPNKKTVTLSDATTWYLQEDPTLPEWILSYRWTLIYIPDMLWHLGVVSGKIELGDKAAYRRVRKHHDIVMTSIKRKVDVCAQPSGQAPIQGIKIQAGFYCPVMLPSGSPCQYIAGKGDTLYQHLCSDHRDNLK